MATARKPLRIASGKEGEYTIGDVLALPAGNQSTNLAKAGGVIFDHATSVGTTGSAEFTIWTDTIWTDTIKGSTFNSVGDKVVAKYYFTMTNVTLATRQIRIYFNNILIFASGLLTTTTSVFAAIEVTLIKSSTTGLSYAVSQTSTGLSLTSIVAVGTIASQTLTNDLALKITGTSSSGQANDIVGLFGYGEWKPAA